MKKYDIVSFGEILIDYTSVGNSSSGQRLFEQNAGGAPANVAVCGARLGRCTAFVGKVGNDMQGRYLVDALDSVDVDTSGVAIDSDHFTTLAFVDISDSGERTFSFARKHGADVFMTPDEIDTDKLSNCTILHVGSLSLTTQLGQDATMHAISCARQSGAIISYDPNYRASLWESESVAAECMASVLPLSDVVKISNEECLLVAGSDDEIQACTAITNMGAHIVCVTLGSKGAYVSVGGVGQYVAGYIADSVVDTTGAGDNFWGAMLSSIATIDKPLHDITLSDIVPAVMYANATASLCIERRGAISAMPTPDEIELRMRTQQ